MLGIYILSLNIDFSDLYQLKNSATQQNHLVSYDISRSVQ